MRPAMRTRLRHLPPGLAGSAVALGLGVVVGWSGWGPVGAAGMAAGVALVAVGYVASSLVVAWADSVAPGLVLPVGLTAYATKVVVLGLVMAAIAGTGWAGLAPMGYAIVGSAVAWMVALSWWVLRARILYVEPVD